LDARRRLVSVYNQLGQLHDQFMSLKDTTLVEDQRLLATRDSLDEAVMFLLAPELWALHSEEEDVEPRRVAGIQNGASVKTRKVHNVPFRSPDSTTLLRAIDGLGQGGDQAYSTEVCEQDSAPPLIAACKALLLSDEKYHSLFFKELVEEQLARCKDGAEGAADD
jgi:hypothetical protein